ncbi:MAG: adenylate/guanylate cyclase domain-containing protein [Verrucomicrobia bacterium]|nr:adenylate/guanylate cyclase domain-containing protein [Verrucomicrobiota bacterium]
MRILKAAILLGAISATLAMLLLASGFPAVIDEGLLKSLRIPMDGRPLWGSPIFVSLVLAFGIAWTTLDITRNSLRIFIVLATAILLCTWSGVVSIYGQFFSPVLPVFTVLCSATLGLLWVRTRSGSRKQNLERLFGPRMSRAGFREILNSRFDASFPGRKLQASVLVVSVHNHAELMELLSPADYTAITNFYLQTASDYLVESGGYLDECNGECIRVVFGAPQPDERHATRACRAAIDLAARIDELNKECDARWQRRLDVRMGLDSGEIVAGLFGGNRLANYSVAGQAVDFARRLCSASSSYGARILIGPDAYSPAAESLEVRPIEILKVSARRRRVEIYEILTAKHGLSPERERSRDHFWTGVLHYREKQWEKAVDEFTKARITGLPDPALDFYLRRIEQSRRLAEDSHKESMPAFQHNA